jgi:Xaa-Pro aminopeptidase
MKRLFIVTILLMSATLTNAQVESMQSQAKIINELLEDRLENLLPRLMDSTQIDCWVMATREYNEDPIVKTFLPAEWLSARRRTILVFYRDAKKNIYKKYAVARYPVGKQIQAAWNPEENPDQWDALVSLLRNLHPNNIALNYSEDFGHADGMDLTEYSAFISHLNQEEKKHVISAEPLAVSWLETRTEKEMTYYPTLLKITHAIIKEGFSNKVIKVNATTANDMVWWFRQKLSDMGLGTWFHPSVEIQRRISNDNDDVIRPGDFLHCDFGISYLRLNSDVQEQAYVLLPTEQTAPADLQEAFTKTNRLQDILTSHFKLGNTGNQILAASLAQAKSENITPSIYTHPIGFHGHAAGTTIGMWDMQGGVPGSGDYKLHKNTCYSIELNAMHTLKGWDKPVRVALEQNGYFNGTAFKYIDDRQTKIHLINNK